MRRITTLLLTLLLLCATLVAAAQGPAVTTHIQGSLTRNIKLKAGQADNPVIPGESPITGLPIEDKKFVPILVQIDNNLAALPQWGIADADIMYEMPIQGGGWTRLTAFFTDKYPGEAGPVRSARVMHADLRESWDALLVNFGKQEEFGSDLREALKGYGVNTKGLAIDGIGNAYKDYFMRVRYHMAPHNVTAYVSRLRDLMVEKGYNFPIKPFLFTDEARTNGQPAQKVTIVHKRNQDSSSSFVYDEFQKGYQRYVIDGPYTDLLKPEQHLIYANVIVLRTKLAYNRSSMNPILPDAAKGQGAAEIFTGGRFIAGAWSRANPQARTVFHDENGEEIRLARGKTWIVVADVDTDVSFDGVVDHSNYLPAGEAGKASAGKTNFESVAPIKLDKEGREILPDAPKTDVKGSNVSQADAGDSQEDGGEADVQDGETATVKTKNKGPLNMRKAAKGNSDIVAQIPHNTKVVVLEQGAEWTKIRYGRITGYVKTSFLSFGK